MSKITKLRFILLVFLLLTTLACGVYLNEEEDADETEALKLQLTVQAVQIEQSSGTNNQDNNTPPQAIQSNSESINQQQSNSQVAETSDDEDDETPCNDSHIIGETISDGTVFSPGDTFKKSWTLRNEGDCDWNTSYKFKFIEGDRMGGESSINLPSVIEPYEDITLIVNLTAPTTAGNYTGVWQLFSDDDEELGRYWVKITVGVVAPPATTFSVSSANLYFTKIAGADNICADITASSAGEVTYKFVDNTNAEKPGAVFFNAAGTKTVCEPTPSLASGMSARIYIDNPNHQWFGPIVAP